MSNPITVDITEYTPTQKQVQVDLPFYYKYDTGFLEQHTIYYRVNEGVIVEIDKHKHHITIRENMTPHIKDVIINNLKRQCSADEFNAVVQKIIDILKWE